MRTRCHSRSASGRFAVALWAWTILSSSSQRAQPSRPSTNACDATTKQSRSYLPPLQQSSEYWGFVPETCASLDALGSLCRDALTEHQPRKEQDAAQDYPESTHDQLERACVQHLESEPLQWVVSSRDRHLRRCRRDAVIVPIV